MKTRIAYKIGLLASLLVLVAALFAGGWAYITSMNVLEEHEIVDLGDETRLSGKTLLEQIAQLREDVLTLAGSPNLQGIIRARVGDDADQLQRDEMGGQSEAELIRKFTDECRQICWIAMQDGPGKTSEREGKPYLRVRLIGNDDDGRELVRIERTARKPAQFEKKDGQIGKAKREYFRQARQHFDQTGVEDRSQGVLLSDVRWSRDSADDEGVHAPVDEQPVLRAMVGVETPTGEFFGVVVIDFDFHEVHDLIANSARHLTFLTDQHGNFLIHPDRKLEFAFEKQQVPATEGDYPDPVEKYRIREELDKFPIKLSEFYASTITSDNLQTALNGHHFDERMQWPKRGFRMLRMQVAGPWPEETLTKFRQTIQRLNDENPVGVGPLVVPDAADMVPLPASIILNAPLNDPDALQKLSQASNELINAAGPDRLKVQYEKDCREFYTSFIRLPYDPHNPDRWLGLTMAFSKEELDAEVADVLWNVVKAIIAAIVLATALAFLFSHMLTRRLSKVTLAAETIAAGHFDVDLPLSSRDEIGELARGFKHMIGVVRAREDDLEIREARLQAVVGGAAEGIIQLKKDGEIREANRAAQRMFKRSDTQMAGRSFRELLAPQEQSRFDDALRRLIKVGGTSAEFSMVTDHPAASSLAPGRREFAPEMASLESIGLRSDDREFPIDISLSLVRLEGEPIVTLIARDITNSKRSKLIEQQKEELERANLELQKAHEQAQELNKAKDGFLASVSHELRNPLNQVSGFCQLLEFSNLDDGQREDIRKIRVANDQLLSLINDILDYQKIIMRGVTLDPEPIGVAGLVREIRDAMSVQANENNNQLVFECSPDAGDLVADRQRIRQVLLNLVGNACKFTNAGTVRLSANRRRDGDNEWIEFAVADTGCGMTPEELGRLRLFQPFFKAGAKKGNKSGTGLGLVISKGFCEMMRGDLRIESEVGVGTTFTVRLPARETDVVPGQAEPPAPGSNGAPRTATVSPVAATPPTTLDDSSSSGRLVLVIDDDPTVCEMMKRHLSNHGFQVATASSGIEGLELAAKLHPAVITLDAIMPGLDGWKVLGALKAGEETARIPVMMVTVMDRPEQGFSRGAADFISKPIDWDRLTASLAHYTGDKRERSLLIVDDDPVTREILRRQLSADGWSILEAENGQEALALLATEQPAAIILDLMMPVMDGFEFIVSYSQMPGSASIPVLVLTAKDPTPEERRLLEGQVIRVLNKGTYSDQDLLTEIHRRVDAHLREEPAAADGGEAHDAEDSGR